MMFYEDNKSFMLGCRCLEETGRLLVFSSEDNILVAFHKGREGTSC